MSPERAKIFLVDENENFRTAVKRILENEGHGVALEAGGLMEALDKIPEAKKQGVNVAIIDDLLGNYGDGALIAKDLRKSSSTIGIIGYSWEGVRFGDRNILKDVGSFDELVETVRQL